MTKKAKKQQPEGEKPDPLNLDPKELYFIPLGGSEQFGVNFNLYAHAGKWLAVDCGIGFADERFPGVDILLPDPAFIAERRKNLTGLIVTHAHEDHVGAIPYLWPRLKCPIHTTEFTAEVLRRKFKESPECRDAKIDIIKPGGRLELGPFTAHFIHVAHSIPDTVSVVIETKAGRILHSGDWNLDPRPVLKGPTDEKSFRAYGKKGIDAYIGDSTNADVAGRAGSESDVEEGLAKLFAEIRGRIAITIFASNIGRIRSIARAAKKNGRHVVLVGRSLHNMTGAARETGHLTGLADFVQENDAERLPHDRLVYIVTGSQGEARAALARIARGDFDGLSFGRGDTIIFSSRAIPGNEAEINIVRNNLAASGARVVTHRDTPHCIHVSGHPCRDEIADMYEWVQPALVVPVHGERTQLEAQAAFARQKKIDNVIVPVNGSVVQLTGKTGIVGQVQTGLLAVEPNRIISADHAAIAERRKLQFTGAVHATVVLDDRGDLAADPEVTTMGLIDPEDPAGKRLEADLRTEIEEIVADMDRDDRRDDGAVHEEVRIGLRRLIQDALGMKPRASVHVIRV